MVWENVAGAFSSSGGADFHAVLEETVKIADQNAVVPRPTDKWAYAGCIVGDGWSVAWRVHDSQWWGVPQRRKRVALVADFNGHSAPDILFELHRETDAGNTDEVIGNLGTEPRPEVQPFSESVCRNPEQGEQARQEAAGEITDGAGKTSSFTLKVRGGREFDRYGKRAGKGALVQEELSGTLGVTQDQTLITEEPILMATNQNDAEISQTGICNTLPASAGMGGGYVPMICNSSGGDISGTLDANYYKGCGEREGIEREVICLEGNGSRDSHKGDGYKESETMYTLNTVEQHAVAYRKTSHAKSAEDGQGWTEAEVNDTLNVYDQGETRTPTIVVGRNIQGEETSNTLVASMTTPVGSTQDRLVVFQESWDGSQVAPTLTANNASGAQRMPDKDNFNAVISLTTEMTPKVDEKGVAFSLRSRDSKDPQCVTYGVDCYNQTQSEEVTQPLRSKNADTDHIPCVYGLDRASFNQGKNAQFDFSVEEELAQPLVARGPGGVLTKQ